MQLTDSQWAAIELHIPTRERRARKVFIETGGKTSYGPTRGFYETAGYREIARIPDFFAVGDDKVIFGKDLS